MSNKIICINCGNIFYIHWKKKSTIYRCKECNCVMEKYKNKYGKIEKNNKKSIMKLTKDILYKLSIAELRIIEHDSDSVEDMLLKLSLLSSKIKREAKNFK